MFQNPMVDGQPLLDHLVAGGNMDATFIGLHQVRLNHHPGIDLQGEVRSIMQNGGRIRYSGWDTSGGGWGVILDGVDACTGVVMELWHLPEDPSTRLPVGALVDGNVILGQHGFSGVESVFIAHNHLTVGFRRQPPFGWPAYQVNDIWWVHAAHVVEAGELSLNWPVAFTWANAIRPLMTLGFVLLLLLWVGPGAARLDWPLVIFGLPLYILTRKAVRAGMMTGLSLTIVLWALALATTLNDRGVFWVLVQQLSAGNRQPSSELSNGFHPAVLVWKDEILAWSAQYGLNPNLVATIMQVESCGNPEAVSARGAQGLFQVMPLHFQDEEPMMDPNTNALRGLSYLTATLAAYPQNIGRAMAAYNGGIAGVASPDSLAWPQETQRYYAWTTGIYSEAINGVVPSPTLEQWLQTGGESLCQQAISVLGLENE